MSSLIVQYFLNHRLDHDELRRQMREIAQAGYEGVYAHARAGLLTPYFSEDWWAALRVLVECCHELGLQLWVWDDDYFPSGLAGGRVVWSDPALAARELRFKVDTVAWSPRAVGGVTDPERSRSVTAPTPPLSAIEVDFEAGTLVRAYAIHEGGITDLTPYCGTRKQEWGPRYLLHRAYSPDISRVAPPHWRSSFGKNRFAVVWTPPAPGTYTLVGVTTGVASETHPDLMRPEGVARFVELTHEEYARRLGKEFGATIVGSFTDEPSPGAWLFPWSDGMAEEFRHDHGYDLLDHLPHLALDLDDRSPTVRHHYRQTQHRLVKANYVDQVGDWLHAHGLQHVGHLTRTEWLSLTSVWWPNELRCYQGMDIPMADPLGGGCGWPEAAAYHTGLKVVSSAAHLFGKPQAGADCFAVIGDETSLRDLKFLADYHLVMGINHFAVHGWSYSLEGPRKDEVPPSLGYQHTEYPQMRVLWDHVRQMAERLTGGEHVCRIAMLHPATSLACQARPGVDWMHLPDETLIHNLSEQLLSHHRDFDLIDEVTLAEMVDDEGWLHAPEPYETIILPYLRYVDAEAWATLERFAGTGGRVIAVGYKPKIVGAHPRCARPEEGAPRVRPYAFWPEATPELVLSLPGVDVVGEGAESAFVLQRRRDGVSLTFAFNRAKQPFSGTIEGEAVWIAPGSSVLISDDPALDARALPPPQTPPLADLSSDWAVSFPANHLPLSFWHVLRPGQPSSAGFTSGATYDLMQRQTDPAPPGEEPVIYACRFMLTGDVPDARLVIEDSTVSGDWTLRVNGHAITEWRRERVMDCRNLAAGVAHALRTGSSPTLNVIEIETSGAGRGLHEVPYLYGSFRAEYRYAHLSFPFLEGESVTALPVLQPWPALGYPTFSGTVAYERDLAVAEGGDLVLDLGRVEDVAEVELDGVPVATLAWEPYRCALRGLTAGTHRLTVRVTNAPANRNRAAMQPAGLLGPVKLYASS